VQLATSVKDGTKYAVKIMTKAQRKEEVLLQLQSEPVACAAQAAGCRRCRVGARAAAGGHAVTPPTGAECVGALTAARCCCCCCCCCTHSTRTDIVKEVAIMRLLSDHPNAVGLAQVLQDKAWCVFMRVVRVAARRTRARACPACMSAVVHVSCKCMAPRAAVFGGASCRLCGRAHALHASTLTLPPASTS
jgi:hypothetical protein